MHRFLPLFMIVALLAGCTATPEQANKEPRYETPLSPNSDAIDDSASTSENFSLRPEVLLADVAYLANDELQGRGLGTAEIEQAAHYIKRRLIELDIEPYQGDYLDSFMVEGTPAANVVGVLDSTTSGKGPYQEIVVIGAHYDHIGLIASIDGDSIANGANDNASGVAAVLAIAEVLKALETRNRKVVVALYSAEESGLLGSKHLAERMKAAGENVVAVLNFEMIGMPMQGREFVTYATGYDISNIAEVFNLDGQALKSVGKLDKAAEFQLFKRSDNYPFYQVFGVPAHTFSTFDFTNFPQYHQVTDEVSALDIDHMRTVVNALLPGIIRVVNHDDLTLY